MSRIKLDKIDRKILMHLQADGRMTNVDLAKQAGISAPPCLRRVRALEESGYIQGYNARLDAAAMGYPMIVFAQVKLGTQSDADLKKFMAMINDWPMVREAYILTGDMDFLLKIVAQDWDHYQHFLTEQLTAAPNVTSVRSSLAVKATKFEPGVPVEL